MAPNPAEPQPANTANKDDPEVRSTSGTKRKNSELPDEDTVRSRRAPGQTHTSCVPHTHTQDKDCLGLPPSKKSASTVRSSQTASAGRNMIEKSGKQRMDNMVSKSTVDLESQWQ